MPCYRSVAFVFEIVLLRPVLTMSKEVREGRSLAKIILHLKAIFAESVLAPAVSTAPLLANPLEKAVHQIRVVVNDLRRELVDPR